MSKIVYRPGDRVQIKLNGVEYIVTIATSEVEDVDPDTGECTVTYTSDTGVVFTDEDIED